MPFQLQVSKKGIQLVENPMEILKIPLKIKLIEPEKGNSYSRFFNYIICLFLQAILNELNVDIRFFVYNTLDHSCMEKNL